MASIDPRTTQRRRRSAARLPALHRHRRRVREAVARGGERPRRRHRADRAAALRPRVHRRHRAAPRAVRAARRRSRSGGQPADARDHGQPARVARALHGRLDHRRRGGRRGLALQRRAGRRGASTRRWRSPAGSPRMPLALARRDQAARRRGPHRRHPRRPGARRADVRRHGRRGAANIGGARRLPRGAAPRLLDPASGVTLPP